jgi:hypothetical protein
MLPIERVHQPTNLIPVPDVTTLKFGQRNHPHVDLGKNRRYIHARFLNSSTSKNGKTEYAVRLYLKASLRSINSVMVHARV